MNRWGCDREEWTSSGREDLEEKLVALSRSWEGLEEEEKSKCKELLVLECSRDTIYLGISLGEEKGVTDIPWTEQEEGAEEDRTEAGRDFMKVVQHSLASWR